MTVQLPIPDYASARQAMIDSQLRPQGVNDPAVLAAMREVERETFVPEASRPLAYIDRSIALPDGRYLPPASALGLLLTAMEPRQGERALVVGASTGYSAAVLARIGCQVTALESSAELAAAAREQGLTVVEGSLDQGYSSGAPYDLILVDGAVEAVPDAISEQLKEGGRIGAAVLHGAVTRLVVGIKAPGGIGYTSIADAGIELLPGFKRPRAFTF